MKFGSIALIAFSLKKVTTKTVNEENIEASEEYLNIKNTVNQVKINKAPKPNDRANKIPKYVATPFPPLNFIQIGKICPKKAISAEIWKYSGKKYWVIATGKYPLKVSNNKVAAAKYLFPDLSTFVAPMFPEPTFLIS